VPLTDLAIEIVETLHLLNSLLGPFLFPARGQPPRPQSTLPQAVQAYCQGTEMQAWTPKDLRRTCRGAPIPECVDWQGRDTAHRALGLGMAVMPLGQIGRRKPKVQSRDETIR
jgi:integrase